MLVLLILRNTIINTIFLLITNGTGDISFRILKYLNINGSQEMKNDNSVDDNPSDNRPKNCTINVVDINQSMLDVGKIRGKKLGYEEGK